MTKQADDEATLLGLAALVAGLLVLGGTPVPGAAQPDHFAGYGIKAETSLGTQTVALEDQFGADPSAQVKKAQYICAPVDKNGEGIQNPDTHLVCYTLQSKVQPQKDVEMTNQLGEQSLEVEKSKLLCVSSSKEILPN